MPPRIEDNALPRRVPPPAVPDPAVAVRLRRIDTRAQQRAMLDYLEGNWRRPDNSLEEMRTERRHFTHSEMMAWVAFDRAVTAVKQQGLDGPTGRWQAVRDEIHADVCANGYDAQRRTFTQSYGSSRVDAALLVP